MLSLHVKKRTAAISLFCSLITNISPRLFAGESQHDPLSVAIISLDDGVSDDESKDIATAIKQALPKAAPIRIISNEIVERTLNQNATPASSNISHARENLSAAKEHYYKFHYKEALALATEAVNILKSENISQNGPLLLDALITQSIIAKSARQEKISKDSLNHTLKLYPFYTVDSKAYPPSMVKLYSEAQIALLSTNCGRLEINSSPQEAQVFINGIFLGSTPFELNKIPVGDYTLLIKTNKYDAIEKQISIKNNESLIINEGLRLVNNGSHDNIRANNTDKEYIAYGVWLSDLLNADKVALIDGDETKNNYLLTIRMIDRKYKAAHRQILAKYNNTNKVEMITTATQTLANIAMTKILDNPNHHLNPNSFGEAVLLTSKKKKSNKHPILWGVIGAAAVGALAGGLAAGFSGGSSSKKSGSVMIEFK